MRPGLYGIFPGVAQDGTPREMSFPHRIRWEKRVQEPERTIAALMQSGWISAFCFQRRDAVLELRRKKRTLAFCSELKSWWFLFKVAK
jgi:hypothetical protein